MKKPRIVFIEPCPCCGRMMFMFVAYGRKYQLRSVNILTSQKEAFECLDMIKERGGLTDAEYSLFRGQFEASGLPKDDSEGQGDTQAEEHLSRPEIQSFLLLNDQAVREVLARRYH